MSKAQTDINQSLSDYSYVALSRIANIFFAGVSAIFITRILGPADYGRLQYFYMMAYVAMYLGIYWNAPVIWRFGKRDYIASGNLKEIFWARSFILFICISILISVSLVFREKINWISGINYGAYYVIAFFV